MMSAQACPVPPQARHWQLHQGCISCSGLVDTDGTHDVSATSPMFHHWTNASQYVTSDVRDKGHLPSSKIQTSSFTQVRLLAVSFEYGFIDFFQLIFSFGTFQWRTRAQGPLNTPVRVTVRDCGRLRLLLNAAVFGALWNAMQPSCVRATHAKAAASTAAAASSKTWHADAFNCSSPAVSVHQLIRFFVGQQRSQSTDALARTHWPRADRNPSSHRSVATDDAYSFFRC